MERADRGERRNQRGGEELQIGTPEQHTPVALRAFPMREEALEKLPFAELPELAQQKNK